MRGNSFRYVPALDASTDTFICINRYMHQVRSLMHQVPPHISTSLHQLIHPSTHHTSINSSYIHQLIIHPSTHHTSINSGLAVTSVRSHTAHASDATTEQDSPPLRVSARGGYVGADRDGVAGGVAGRRGAGVLQGITLNLARVAPAGTDNVGQYILFVSAFTCISSFFLLPHPPLLPLPPVHFTLLKLHTPPSPSPFPPASYSDMTPSYVTPRLHS